MRREIQQFNVKETAGQIGDVLARAELAALQSEAEILESQINEYEMLQSGAIQSFRARSLGELPTVLIQARIAQRLSQRELAELVGLKEQQIQRYESEGYASSSLRRLREIADALKLNITEIAEIASSTAPKHSEVERLDWSKFPIKEMYRRGWFEGFTGTLDMAIQDADFLVQEFVGSVFKKPLAALHRKQIRSGQQTDQYALMAWECRILNLVTKAGIRKAYQPETITSAWITELVKLSSRPDGPLLAKAMLDDAGIPFVIEPHLPNTYLDGAALLFGELPVIALTLRFDRLDNFWFVLLHELFHVLKHLRKGKIEGLFDNEIELESKETIELEADNMASDALIPSDKWHYALARYTRSEEAIFSFARELGISSAIVAGRIRHESNNYTILTDLVGQNEARRQFPEVNFGI